MKLRSRILLLACLCCATIAIAQPFGNAYKFITYTTNQGLVHNFTKKCVQDSKGFLWIITQHGLSRFDGLTFKNFENIPSDSTSLPVNDLMDIAIDAQDNIWLAYSRGICVYDQSKRKFQIIDSAGKKIPSYTLCFDAKRNCIWSANYTQYVAIDCKTRIPVFNAIQRPQLLKYGFGKMMLDHQDRLWIPYERKGYHTIQLQTKSSYYFDEDIWPMSFYKTAKGEIYLATWQSGFRKIDANTIPHQHIVYNNNFLSSRDPYGEIFHGIAAAPEISGDSILWVTTESNGILLFNKNSQQFTRNIYTDNNDKNATPTDFYQSPYTDKNGILWLCTWHGLVKLNPLEQQFKSRELPFLKTKLYNRVAGIVKDPIQPNQVWIAVEGSGMVLFDLRKQQIVQRFFYDMEDTGIDPNYDWRWVTELVADDKGSIWGFSYGGLIEIKKGKVYQYPMKFNSGYTFPNNILVQQDKIWIASSTGLWQFNKATHLFKQYLAPYSMAKDSLHMNVFKAIIPEDEQHFLLAGYKGIHRFSLINNQFERLPYHINAVDSIAQQIAYVIQKIDRNLYIGTSIGLLQYNLDNHLAQQIGLKEGIDKILERRLLADSKKQLWIFSSTGLYKFVPGTNNFQRFGTNDGIYDFSEDPISFFSYDSQFHIGYRMAITSFDPRQVNVHTQKANPLITDVFINNELVELTDAAAVSKLLSLKYTQNALSINFTAVDFTNSDKISFACKLEGYDTNWVYMGTSRKVAYNNLNAGKYRFLVKSCNSSGIWSEQEASFEFIIHPPFWKTIWFMLLTFLMVVTIVYFIYQYRLSQIKKYYKMRNDISRNLHDEIGATLSSINIYSDVARKKTTDIELQKILNKIYVASSNTMESISDIVWYINPKNDQMENLIIRMREYALPLLEAKHIQVQFLVADEYSSDKFNMQQRQHVYLIFKEAINNMLKYAQATEVHIALESKNGIFSMLIKDNGVGFNSALVQQGNGLTNMQQRAAQLKGSIEINTEEGKGTTICLQCRIA
ncbi:MAG: triple tyrosine motif-containing protein [Ferruginibacter sp.]